MSLTLNAQSRKYAIIWLLQELEQNFLPSRTFAPLQWSHENSERDGWKWPEMKTNKKKDVALIAGYPVQVGEIGKRRNIWELCSCERNKALQNTFWAAWEHWTNNPEPVKLHLHESMWHTCCTLLYPPAMAGAGYRPCVQDAGWAAVSSHGNCCLMGLQGEQAHDSNIPGGPANLATQSWLRYSWREVSVGDCRRWQWAGRSGQTGRSLQPGLGTCGYCKGCEWKGPAWRCSHSSEQGSERVRGKRKSTES